MMKTTLTSVILIFLLTGCATTGDRVDNCMSNMAVVDADNPPWTLPDVPPDQMTSHKNIPLIEKYCLTKLSNLELVWLKNSRNDLILCGVDASKNDVRLLVTFNGSDFKDPKECRQLTSASSQ